MTAPTSSLPTPSLTAPAARRPTGRIYAVVIAAVMAGALAAWLGVAKRRLDAAVVADAAAELDHARATFDALRARTLSGLLAQCRVLVEDPRLKTTLATEGVDEATVRDILADVLHLRRVGLLLVLSLEGRVFAEAGAAELRGLDLSGASVMARARGATDAVGGTWLIGGKLIDLAVAPVLLDCAVLAYVVVGQAIDAELVEAVGRATGVAVAVLAGPAPAPVSTADPGLGAAFAAAAAEPVARAAHILPGDAYVAATFELEGTPQSHPRLAVARALAPPRATFAPIAALLWIPCVLVVIGVALGALRGRVGLP